MQHKPTRSTRRPELQKLKKYRHSRLMVKKILLGLLLLFMAIQFIRQSKNLGASPGPADLFAQHEAPAEVKQLLQTACYDCHSNTTRYPWYAEVQPVGWFLADHVKEGKQHLNFSEFDHLTPKRAARKLEQCTDEVTEGGMPLASYRLLHPEARLTGTQRKQLVDWFGAVREKIPVTETK
jgi:hypothetical protein